MFTLKQIMRESLDAGDKLDTPFRTSDEAIAYIAAQDPDAVADRDIFDDETGEVHLEMGQRFRDAQSHPEYVPPQRPKKSFSQSPMSNDAWVEIEDELEAIRDSDDMPDDGGMTPERAFIEMNAAIRDFAAGFTPDDIANGAAEDSAAQFFAAHDEWRAWSTMTGMSRREIALQVADAIASAGE